MHKLVETVLSAPLRVLALSLAFSGGARDYTASSVQEPDAKVDDLEGILSRSEISLVTTLGSGFQWTDGITGKEVPATRLPAYLALLFRELSLYPENGLKEMGLTKIVLCTKLVSDGDSTGGVMSKGDRVLYLEAGDGSEYPAYQAKTLHHELFHAIDLGDAVRDGTLVYVDEDWVALNPTGEDAYTRRSFEDIGHWEWCLNLGSPGFVTAYATMDVAEDKAETFANMMVLPSWVDLACRHDTVLASKVGRMKSILGAYSREFDEKFWIRMWATRKKQGSRQPSLNALEVLRSGAVDR